MERYRVKADHKTWNDKGPDLLRKGDNALKEVRARLDGRNGHLYVRRGDERDKGEWRGPLTKGDALDITKYWIAHHREPLLSIGQKHEGDDKVEVVVSARFENVERVPLAHCTKPTEELHSLVHHQFPKVIHSGGFYYREVDGAPGVWSDHAWGTAIDESQNLPKGVKNDEVFDWQARMAQSGNINPDYILGSNNGKVVQASAPDYRVRASKSSTTHLWHVHTSQVDHDGRKPPRNPMVP